VYAAGFSYALLGEQLGPAGFAGGGLLVAAAVGTQLWNRRAADAEVVEDAE
jgi:drug/metabolite transporter (DMT)-like permease